MTEVWADGSSDWTPAESHWVTIREVARRTRIQTTFATVCETNKGTVWYLPIVSGCGYSVCTTRRKQEAGKHASSPEADLGEPTLRTQFTTVYAAHQPAPKRARHLPTPSPDVKDIFTPRRKSSITWSTLRTTNFNQMYSRSIALSLNRESRALENTSSPKSTPTMRRSWRAGGGH